MDIRTLMVHLELGGDNSAVLAVAGDLATRCSARVIGIAACQPAQVLPGDGFGTGDASARDWAEKKKELAAAEAAFRAALAAHAPEWRSIITYGSLADYVAEEARAADLIVTGKDRGASLLDQSRRVNIGDLTMRAGRPVLLVPHGAVALAMRHVFIGWKETREARRAVADALSLLTLAARATVLEVTSEAGRTAAQRHVEDVAAWLEEHRVQVTPQVLATMGTQSSYLRAELLDRKCDLLVAGAYGHNRLTEWVFGGMTQDMLMNPDFCVLLSH